MKQYIVGSGYYNIPWHSFSFNFPNWSWQFPILLPVVPTEYHAYIEKAIPNTMFENSFAISGNGSVIAIAADFDFFISTNSGSTWTKVQDNDGELIYADGVALNGNGSVLLAWWWGGGTSVLKKSVNYGVTWTDITPAGAADAPSDVLVDSTGNIMVFLNQDAYPNYHIYYSDNGGTSWTKRTTAVKSNIRMSDDGGILILADGKYLSKSVDSGQNWTTIKTLATNCYYRGLELDADGSTIVCSIIKTYSPNTYCVSISTNGGTDWTDYTPTTVPQDFTNDIFVSDDGTQIIVEIQDISLYDNYAVILYASYDSGASWADTVVTHICPTQLINDTIMDSSGDNIITLVGKYDNLSGYSDASIPLISEDNGVTWDYLVSDICLSWDWGKVRISGNGVNIIAHTWEVVWLKYGGAWQQILPTGVEDTFDWQAIAIDYDGSNIIAAIENGRMYSSSNHGIDWDELRPKGNMNGYWYDAAMDSDGSTIIICEYWGRLYYSHNGGTDWTKADPTGDQDENWESVACNNDGSILLATGYGDVFYISTDGGLTWDPLSPGGISDADWLHSAMSNNGQVIFAATWDEKAYFTTNGGSSWTQLDPTGDPGFETKWVCAVSDDGNKIIVADASGDGGGIWTSIDRGITWDQIEYKPLDFTYYGPYSVDCDADGSNMVSCGWPHIYNFN